MRVIRWFGTKVKKVFQGRWFKRLAIYPSILAISFAGGYFTRTGTDARMVVVDPQPVPRKFDTKPTRDALPQKNLRNIAGQGESRPSLNRSSQPQTTSFSSTPGLNAAPFPATSPSAFNIQPQNSIGGSHKHGDRDGSFGPTNPPPMGMTHGSHAMGQITYSEAPSLQQSLSNHLKKYLESKAPEERLQAQKELIDLIVSSFDSTQAAERTKIDAFEKRLAVWKRAVEKRESMKREVVEGYLAQMLGIPNPTSWNFSGEGVMNSLSTLPDQESLESYWGQPENNTHDSLKDDKDASAVPQLEKPQPPPVPEPTATY